MELEAFEWGEFGDDKPSMKEFARWLIEIGETDVASITRLRWLQHEHAVHTSTRGLTERQIAHAVASCSFFEKYRARGRARLTRYRVTTRARLRLAA